MSSSVDGRWDSMHQDASIVRSIGRLVGLGCLCMTMIGCGYSLAGRGSFLPEHIQTIGVPLFINNTTFFDVEETLTHQVRTEFIGRGTFRVVPDATGVDALLSGEILNITLVPSGFTPDQLVSRYALRVTSKIEFRDLQDDRVLWENPAMLIIEEFEVVTAGAALDASAFFGQDANALTRVSESFARAVVTSILEAF